MQETWVQSLGWEDPLEKGWQPTPVFLPGEFHGQKSLVGYSPWGDKESDMTEQLTHTHTLGTYSALGIKMGDDSRETSHCLSGHTPLTGRKQP